MSTAVPPIPAENAPAGLSQLQRIVNTFISPRRTFEDVGRNPSWWAPWLLLSIVFVASGMVFLQKIDMEHFIRQQIEQSSRAAQFEQATPAQQEQGLRFGVMFAKIQTYAWPVWLLLGGLLLALVLWVIFSFGFGAEVGFSRSLAISFYGLLPLVISTLLFTIVLVTSSDPNSIDIRNPVATNPAYFMDPTANKFLYGLIKGVDVIRLWFISLLALGFSVSSRKGKVSFSSALTTLFVIYGFIVLIFAGLAARG